MITINEHTYKLNRELSQRSKTSEIILHCSATACGKDFKVTDIDRWHKQRKFTCIGYHFVIYRDGSIHRGRPLTTIGAHCSGHNSKSVGICYIGGCDINGMKPQDTRTEEQKAAIVQLLKHLKEKYPKATIHGHNEFAAKACPSFNVKKEYGEI